jgi:hypothetical protein
MRQTGTQNEPAVLVYTWWERLLNVHSEALGGDREFTELSNKLDQLRTEVFADRELTEPEREALYARMEAVAKLYAAIAGRKGIAVNGSAPASRESFRVFREAAEIHFQTLAGEDTTHYRGGLLRQLIEAQNPEPVAHRIALDLLCSVTGAIARDKIHLLRAQLSLLGDGSRQRALLESVRRFVDEELKRPVWTQGGRQPALTAEEFDRAGWLESVVALRRIPLPPEVTGTNRLFPNRPISGWDLANRAVIRDVLADLRAAGKLFVDYIEPSARPYQVALKVELNLGIEGPPSVTDPAATYAVIAELLEEADRRGVRLQFTVGDSNGIENAPIGHTSLDVMRDTGNFHAALKAALEFASKHDAPGAGAALEKLHALERAGSPVFFGSQDDRVSSPEDLAEVEAVAAPWVVCVDYDVAGFRAIQPDFGPLARAIWGSNHFHVAESWVTADYRVHVTRAASNHAFAGWTGSLKGLIGLHALGGRPADLGMRMRGGSPLQVLAAVMQSASFTGLFATRFGLPDFESFAARCTDADCLSAIERGRQSWSEIERFSAGRDIWKRGATALAAELDREHEAGASEIEIMAKMRRRTAALLVECEQASPGFRASLWQGVIDGTRAFLLTSWRLRDLVPAEMRDERMGMRIGLLSRLPHQADLVVQAMPKIGLGGGPDAYFEVRDVGVIVAGTDEMSVDLMAIREAGVPGNPWAFAHPIHGALQFGRGPMSWDEIRVVSAA